MSDYGSLSRAIEVFGYAAAFGVKKAKESFGLTDETFKRYMRGVRNDRGWELPARPNWLHEIAEKFSDAELQAIAKGGRLVPGSEPVPVVSFGGKHFRIGAMSDLHIGHKCFSSLRLEQAFDEFRKREVDMVTISGDITEGMSNRPGQIYELDHLGFDAQKHEAIRLLGQWTDTDVYMIDGNHDRWFLKSNGAIIVKDIAEALDNYHFLGHDEGDISLDGRATIKLWHGEDGNSYALSYRLQKIIESMSGGEKPNVLIAGHVHKYANIFERNVWCVSAGCLESQTKWMRGKRLAAHVGFCILDVWVGKRGVTRFQVEWYPFYA